MKNYYKLAEILKDKAKLIKHFTTFETPIYMYKYENIEFSLLFDEMIDEPFISVKKDYNYKRIELLIQDIINTHEFE